MNFKTILLAVLFIALGLPLFPQDTHPPHFCGTQDGRVEWLVRYQQNGGGYQRSGTSLFLPIKIHIVGDSQGEGYFGIRNVLEAFCTLNNDFGLSEIQFFISGGFNYINNNNFYEHTFQQGNQMMTQNNVANVINCYIVADPAGNCGYSNYSRGIALAKGCLSPGDHTWAHEIGHYLSLPHTFFGWEGTDPDFPYDQPAPNFVDGRAVEKTDGSNCQNAADGFCDTPADYLAYRWPCNSDNQSNQVQTDPTGAAFQSDGTLFMSYANDNCSGRFSEEQIDAMHANVNEERNYLIGQMAPLAPITDPALTPILPEMGSTVDFFENVFLEWEPIPNASGYVVELSRLPAFPFVEHVFHTQGTSLVATGLKAGNTYYWRLWPFNAEHTCKQYATGTATFQTGFLSSTQEISEINAIEVVPNPAMSGNALSIALDMAEPLSLEVKLLNLSGQVLWQTAWKANSGHNRYTIGTSDLPSGVYLLQLMSENGVVSRKVVVR